MRYRYNGEPNDRYPLLSRDSVWEMKVLAVPALNMVKILKPFDIEYPSWSEFYRFWTALTLSEERAVEGAEKKYKKRLLSIKEVQELLQAIKEDRTERTLLLLNGNYYETTGSGQEELLKMINGMSGAEWVGGVAKSRVHTVISPFMSRDGQFEEGKRSLVIGLDVVALERSTVYTCFLGKNKSVSYQIEATEALRLAEKYRSTWTNKKGRTVAILPIKDFMRLEVANV